MTDAELYSRMERLSDDDLQAINNYNWGNGLLNNSKPSVLLQRMTREILNLRTELAANYDSNEMYDRGKYDGLFMACDMVKSILNGHDNGSDSSSEPWESVRRRLLALVQRNTELKRCPNMFNHPHGFNRCGLKRGHDGRCFYVESMD